MKTIIREKDEENQKLKNKNNELNQCNNKLIFLCLSKRSELKNADSTSPAQVDSNSRSKEASSYVPSIFKSDTKFLSKSPSTTGTLQLPPKIKASFGLATA